jgi:bifunctional non-homologous end joining protein LigD
LLLGYYNDSKELIYAGRTGTGFNQKTHREIRTRLEKLRRVTSPFDKPPAEARKGAIWTTPELVAQVRFATWTADNLLRQAAFQGLREDKAADEVRREGPSVKAGEARRVSRTVSKAAAKSASPAKKAERDGAPATMRLTHPDKLIDAESKLTKRELADYYWAIAPHMLRQIAGRPVSLVRCPDGTAGQCFFQKHVNKMLPAGVESVDVPDAKTGKIEPYITISTQEVLGAMAQIGVLELHPWGARNEDLEHPDRIIFDLDPDVAISWGTLAAAAAEVRKRLKKLGLESFLKSTAGKGLHVVAPVVAEYGWSTIKQLCHAFVLELEASERSLYLTKMMKSARAGKIYLDYLRNERGATAVAAFSPRSRAGAPVSMPLSWSELKLETRPVFRVADYSEWKARLARDPWKRLPEMRQHLTAELLKRYKIQPVR